MAAFQTLEGRLFVLYFWLSVIIFAEKADMKQKPYSQLTPEEQLEYIQRLSKFETLSLPALEPYAKGGTMTAEHKRMAEEGMKLLAAFPVSRDFAEKGLYFRDYERRVYRLRHYVNKIKDEIAKEVVVQTHDGATFAYVPKMQQQFRRRGRPTREEAAAMANAPATDAQTKKQQAIAQMMGVEIVTNQVIREKNNEELAQERKAKEDAQAKMNPSLFDNQPTANSGQQVLAALPPAAYERATLSQLSFLLSPELAEIVATVRDLRNQASAAAETAKAMAQAGKSPDEVKPYAEEAAEATEGYERIYDAVDRELATVYLRLKEDQTYRADFTAKHYQNVPPAAMAQQLAALEKLLKPYFMKQDKAFTAKVRKMIADNNPEVVAAKEKEAEKKKAAEKLIKYLRRQDKENTPRRIEGMEKKFAELEALIGKKEAKPYYIFVEKARAAMLSRQKS